MVERRIFALKYVQRSFSSIFNNYATYLRMYVCTYVDGLLEGTLLIYVRMYVNICHIAMYIRTYDFYTLLHL